MIASNGPEATTNAYRVSFRYGARQSPRLCEPCQFVPLLSGRRIGTHTPGCRLLRFSYLAKPDDNAGEQDVRSACWVVIEQSNRDRPRSQTRRIGNGFQIGRDFYFFGGLRRKPGERASRDVHSPGHATSGNLLLVCYLSDLRFPPSFWCAYLCPLVATFVYSCPLGPTLVYFRLLMLIRQYPAQAVAVILGFHH
jgi:hypothetical protein